MTERPPSGQGWATPGAFCTDCPDHEACSQGAPCHLVKRDQPVTPDRDALWEAIDRVISDWPFAPPDNAAQHWSQADAVLDALLPLLTEALDRARQQGREEMRAEERHHLALLITAEAHAVEGTEREDSAQGLRCAARLMRAADRKAINE